MSTPLFKADKMLAEAFQSLVDSETLDDFSLVTAQKLAEQAFHQHSVQGLLKERGIRSMEQIKPRLLDLLLSYMHYVLDDGLISEKERLNIKILKTCFDIEEGDFFKHRQHEVQRVLSRQFERLYADGMVDKGEAVHNVYLQEIFGLSYDQFDAFKAEAVNNALKQGADITDLDTASNPLKQ